MKTIAYCSPLVPTEWIAAHGLRPEWLLLGATAGLSSSVRSTAGQASSGTRPLDGSGADTAAADGRVGREGSPAAAPGTPARRRCHLVGRGVCPYAAAILEAAAAGIPAAAVVLATTCDQVRRIADLVGRDAHLPMFLLNVPATWQTPAARALYAEEIERLGRFLLSLGGVRPTAGQLTEVMLRYQRARTVAVAARNRMPARRFAETLIAARSSGQAPSEPVEHCAAADSGGPPGRVPLALLGGPLVRQDYDLFDLVERAGGSIVLDASEGGCRTLPAPFDTRQMAADPLTALGAAYFGIPDVFRRPNDPLHQWLGRELPAHGVRGIIFRRYVWCDLWHAELHRLKQSSPVPLLEIDVADDDRPVASRTEARIEAFLEMLR